MGSITSTMAAAKYSSTRTIPSTPMFWAISTALVLQGVIMVARGPTNSPSIEGVSRAGASPKSHWSFVLFSEERGVVDSTTKTFDAASPKN